MENQPTTYGADKITVLKGLEAVRKRPAMYIGDVGIKGLHHLVWEVVDNSIDEAMAGHCSQIEIIILKDGGIKVTDNGRGIPVDINQKEGKSGLELVMTVLHAGGKFDKDTYKVSGGLHGVGVSVVNALSQKCTAIINRDGKITTQTYKEGKTNTPIKTIGKTDETGTTIVFYPDQTIFQTTQYDFNIIDGRIRELAYLNKGIKIVLIDEREKEKRTEHYYKGGLSEFVLHLDEGLKPVFEAPITINGEKENVPVDIALRYNDSYNDNILTFVNNINTIEGGTHLAGFKTALTRAINQYAQKNNIIKPHKGKPVSLSGDDTREGLTVVLSIKVPEPQFEGQTKTKLGNGEIKGICDSIIMEGLSEYLEQNPNTAKRIILKAESAARAREAAKKAREEKKTFYVNIVAGENTPAHAFKGRNNVYKASEYTEGQWTILGIDPKGELVQDHYQHGEYGKVGRDGISYQHAVKTFKATKLREAAKRAEESDKKHDWEVILSFDDAQNQVFKFDTFAEYEEFYKKNRDFHEFFFGRSQKLQLEPLRELIERKIHLSHFH